MWEFLRQQSGDTLVALAGVLMLGGGGFLVAAWGLWLRHRAQERQDELKREMVERGMSADEIVRVLDSGTSLPGILGKTRSSARAP